jgi:membrane associated rhomboid family serine protease
MAYRGRTRITPFLSARYFPTGTKWLLIANVTAFVVFFFTGRPLILELVPKHVVELFMVWQLATYMFLHGGFGHIIWNMLALWMFGSEIEREWGTRRFVKYYFICGVGAGVCVVVANYLVGTPEVATIGSSGAIFGVLLAYAMLFPTRTIMWGFLIPIQARWFVLIIGAVSFMMSLGGVNTGVSEFAHLGGLLVGYVYLKAARIRLDPLGAVRQNYSEWKRRRLKKKFQVYLKKHDSDRGPWVH